MTTYYGQVTFPYGTNDNLTTTVSVEDDEVVLNTVISRGIYRSVKDSMELNVGRIFAIPIYDGTNVSDEMYQFRRVLDGSFADEDSQLDDRTVFFTTQEQHLVCNALSGIAQTSNRTLT